MPDKLPKKVVQIRDYYPTLAGTIFHLTKDKTKYISSDLITYKAEETKSPAWSNWFIPYTPLMSAKIGDMILGRDNSILEVVEIMWVTEKLHLYDQLKNGLEITTFTEAEKAGYKLIPKKSLK